MRVLFVLFSTFIGLFAGTAVGAAFFVPKGSGPAGPATALMYGVAVAVLALAGSWMASRKMAPRPMKRATMVLGLISVLLGAWLTYRAQTEGEAASRGSAPAAERTPAVP